LAGNKIGRFFAHPVSTPTILLAGQAVSGQEQGRWLSLRLILPWLVVFLGVGIPLVAWTDAYDPGPWRNYSSRWDNPLSAGLAAALCTALSIIPLAWMLRHRVLDLVTLALAQEALIFSGYFYIDLTAAHIPEATYAIMQMAGLVVLFNAVGFLFFFSALGASYGLARFGGYALAPLGAPPAALDRRLTLLMRGMSLACAGSIALPMVLTHQVPLLSSAGAESRLDLVMDNDAGRAIYHTGTALLPFVIATLVVAMVREPRRIVGWDGAMTALMVVLQLLTSNRLPLSITLMVTLCLLTMQYRVPRSALVAALVGYIVLFTFLSGFTSLLRTDPHALESDHWLGDSIQEAYLGDNIIDLRDGAWVMSQWDFQPLLGRTYLGGAFSMLPSGIFPQKKQWHLGLTGVRIVGLPEDAHFGLRITFFGEAFLNFGWAGVVMLGTMLGAAFGLVLRQVHLAARADPPCLSRNLSLLILLQCGFTLTNTSDAFILWVLLAVLGLIWLFVIAPARREAALA
jgi:hypothetical protein